MKMFVAAAQIFTVLMYLIFAFAFPINEDNFDGKLFDLYNTIMVLDIISAILVCCQLMSGGRRIELINPTFGKVVRQQGLIFLLSNLTSAIVFYLLGNHLIILGNLNFVLSVMF